MKLRLIEEYNVKYGTTRYAVERKTWNDIGWRTIDSFADEDEATRLYERFKSSRGDYWRRQVLDDWST